MKISVTHDATFTESQIRTEAPWSIMQTRKATQEAKLTAGKAVTDVNNRHTDGCGTHKS